MIINPTEKIIVIAVIATLFLIFLGCIITRLSYLER